jgi:hypothetical protein
MEPRQVELGEDGQAMVEFALTFPLILTMVTLIMQFALSFNGTALVRYAAYNAARSASVHMPINGNDAYASDVQYFGRFAAALSMAPACPKGFGGLFGGPPGGTGSIGSLDITDRLGYAWGVMSVVDDAMTLETKDGATSGWVVRDPVIARVNFYYPLMIPPANKLIWSLASGGQADGWSSAFYAMSGKQLKTIRMTGKAAFVYSGLDNTCGCE